MQEAGALVLGEKRDDWLIRSASPELWVDSPDGERTDERRNRIETSLMMVVNGMRQRSVRGRRRWTSPPTLSYGSASGADPREDTSRARTEVAPEPNRTSRTDFDRIKHRRLKSLNDAARAAGDETGLGLQLQQSCGEFQRSIDKVSGYFTRQGYTIRQSVSEIRQLGRRI